LKEGKKMKGKLNLKRIITLTIVIISVITVILVYNFANQDKSAARYSNRSTSVISESDYQPKNIDISNVILDEETRRLLSDSSKTSLDREIKNYKKVIAEFNPCQIYLNKINKEIEDGNDIDDVFICYNFINEKYGNIEEMDKLLSQKKEGLEWKGIFEEYCKTNKEFTPSNFEEGFIEKELNGNNIDTNDIMIADRISQKGVEKFQELIDKRKKGESWRDIKSSLGIINLEEKLGSISITSGDVEKYRANVDLSDDEIISALVLARKSNVSDSRVLEEINNGKNHEEIYAEIYTDKFKN
jgi:membrane-associated HD superfamily phosphohydrolase